MAALHGFGLSLALLLCIVASSHCEPVDVALNKPIEANVTCGYLSPEPFLSNRYVYSSSAVRENMTQMCADRTAYPPGAMVDGRDDTWWQSASRRIIIDVLGSSARYDAEIFIDLQQVCNKKLSCRREAARCFVSLNISPSHFWSLKVIRNDTPE